MRETESYPGEKPERKQGEFDMSFDVMEFLREYGGGAEYDDSAFRGEVLRVKVLAGIGVFAGKHSKFFPVTNRKLGDMTKAKAIEYAKGLGLSYEPKVEGAIQQTWYTPVISKEKQPNWNNGRWEEMRRRTVVNINGKYCETGDWLLFNSQWTGDNPPMTNDDFGKELWVHAVYKRHPDFDPEFPNKYTCRMKDDNLELDKDGKPIPVSIRIVKEVIGETEAEARAWYAARADGQEVTAESTGETGVTAELAKLYDGLTAGLCTPAEWEMWAKEIFNGFHNKEDVSGWLEVGVKDTVIDEIGKLATKYPAF